MKSQLVRIGVELGQILAVLEMADVDDTSSSVQKPRVIELYEHLDTVFTLLEEVELEDKFPETLEFIRHLNTEYGPFEESDNYEPGGLIKSFRSKVSTSMRNRRTLKPEEMRQLITHIRVWLERFNSL